MKRTININENWLFFNSNPLANASKEGEAVNIPHTWNAFDGADGGNDYYRGICRYAKKFARPEGDRVFLRFRAVNSTARVLINGNEILMHNGGYSTFGCEITDKLADNNTLIVFVDNSKNETVYPQTADFTFYGGIYRDVELICADKNCFNPFFYDDGMKITTKLENDVWSVRVDANILGSGSANFEILDGKKIVANGRIGETVVVDNPTLWNGVKNPYLYTAKVRLDSNGTIVDEIATRFGFRTFSVDVNKGFILNGEIYPLHGTCRHQDRKGLGNAITKKEHKEDIDLIMEMGANTLRLAHYQHDDFVYRYADEKGLIVWAEIPYISRHMPEAHGEDDNAASQMRELIYQQFNRPCICFWGVSNEITMFPKHKKDMLRVHKELNELCHALDPNRLTTLACYAMCGFNNKSAFITDVVSWNLYLGWYTPFMILNEVWLKIFKILHPKRVIGYSEYGAEGMPNLHSIKPHRGDNTEEYQCLYHEYMLRFFERNSSLWATHLWNTFDFAADARNQGGEPGMNHKGVITYDRKIKKDAFYLYKAYWTESPFVHICGKRFEKRTGSTLKVKVYSNCDSVTLYVNDKLFGKLVGRKVFEFKIPFENACNIRVENGNQSDSASFYKVDKLEESYILRKTDTKNWQK